MKKKKEATLFQRIWGQYLIRINEDTIHAMLIPYNSGTHDE